ncbi:MAG: (d)CMP kinase, partial [Planctomycetota bacterium]
IDGPAGAGKSTVARALAIALGWAHLDTGAMFRAITLRLLETGQVPAADGRVENEAELERTLAALDLAIDAKGRVLLDGVDVAARIREPRVDAAVSAVAANPAVRGRLRDAQRAFARGRPTVAEGRDLGTVVFPRARWKIWLDASLAERARRRALEQRDRSGSDTTALRESEVARAMAERDRADSSRVHAPLEQAADAVVVDTTGLTIEQVVARLVTLVRAGRGSEVSSA